MNDTKALVDRLDVVDALYRFAAGQDLGDKELFRSAWAADAELDFVQPARRLGVDLPPFKGRDNITESIIGSVSGLTTTHTVTNPRVTIDGDRATLFALVEAQHLPKTDHSRHLLLKNFYWCDLVREAGAWKIRRMRIENAWIRGDAQVLFPAPSTGARNA
ncbi:MAG: nuclear transport factor 2 family protein [Ramlibacter sp.]|nr:nuclear transport factor 2 family protein [Ramlibacter sp.]